tara:strand:+ start:213 stop:800 length:588 start_codon:yes stop_codon:yes gene_type:complete
MGNLCWSSTAPVVECIQELQRVEQTLQHLIDKYDKQIREHHTMAREKMYNKPDCLRHIKTIQLIKRHKQTMESRLTNCMTKRYQLESLNVTKMHIDAVKKTSETFRLFVNKNDVEKVTKMQDTLCEMIDDACEITQVLNEPIVDIDDGDIEEEYETLCSELQLPVAPRGILPDQGFTTNYEMVDLGESKDRLLVK